MSQVVPVRIPKDILEKVELLVKLGKYANKSEALRAMVAEHLDEMKGLLAYGEANLGGERIYKLSAILKDDDFLELCKTVFAGSETSSKLIEEQRGE